MNAIKILGIATQINGRGTTVPGIMGLGAEYVLMQHSHMNDRIIEVQTGAGVTYGSFHMSGQTPLILHKERDHIVTCEDNDVYGTSVVFSG